MVERYDASVIVGGAVRRAVPAGAGLVAAVLVGVLAGCASSAGPAASGGSAPVSGSHPAPTGGSLPSCGNVPVSSGPASSVSALRVEVASAATAGATVPVRAELQVRADAARIVADSSLSHLLIVRGGAVVGRADATTPVIVPMALRAGANRPVQVLPDRLSLRDCAGGTLPAGAYEVVGVLGYRLDALNSAASPHSAADLGPPVGHTFVLVSPAAPITLG